MVRPDTLRLVRQVAWISIAVSLVVVLVAVLWRVTVPEAPPAPSHTGEADIRSEFALVDHTGRAVTEADFSDRWQLVFFGFTHCPDVCPTTLAYMASVLDELGGAADRVAPLFITVDPARDTVPVMAEYVRAFHPQLIGLTGTEENVAAAMSSFRSWAERVDDPTVRDGYSMAHAGHIYLMTPEGRFVDVYQERDQGPEAMADEILARMEEA